MYKYQISYIKSLSWFKNCQILPGDLLDQSRLGQIIPQLGMEASTFGGSAIPEKDAEVEQAQKKNKAPQKWSICIQ